MARRDDLINVEGGAEDPQYAAAKRPYGAKDRPFEALTELRLVLGMDDELFLKVQPHVTVISGRAQPDPAFANAPVLLALGLTAAQVAETLAQRQLAESAGGPPLAASGSGTYSISSRATRPDGTRVQVQAAIRVGGGGGFGQLYLPLSWRVGESD